MSKHKSEDYKITAVKYTQYVCQTDLRNQRT